MGTQHPEDVLGALFGEDQSSLIRGDPGVPDRSKMDPRASMKTVPKSLASVIRQIAFLDQ